MTFTEAMELVGRTMDVAGVAAIVVGALVAALLTLTPRRRPGPEGDAYTAFRRRLGRAILLGLELLVAADIIRTVAISPTFESVAVLGLIVLIRTFLSWSLELEISGRWPWQKGAAHASTARPAPGPAADDSRPDRARHDGEAPA
ncbi:DUF1622 domain-containing protein [Rhodococcus sp. IEGM 1408]|uniref:DUF1622 domain-containing protein n=1 Tax=Rhodococcus sp. IEGM 1408 TaxID=3082220 RepID=UPI002953306A|nr:DUF1622 domain-containing protein [Rhodococcus sp. IEGM 1408]MDV8000168.1 DUF1622 domain-containing protein [Rhodococcus sp. IEGM 1408]